MNKRHTLLEKIHDKIKETVINWHTDIQNLDKHPEIIALHFGVQQVFDGFELYLSGHSWYDGHDLWLLEEEWAPKENYISLGEDSLEFNRGEIIEVYKRIVEATLRKAEGIYNELIIVLGEVDGEPKRIK